jgi:aminotransferase
VINTPANPSGKVFSREELDIIAKFCLDHDLIAITDEVYEFMVFDGLEHVSLATLPDMWPRTVTISSFGKMLSATGWRVGYVIAPEELIREIGYSNEYEAACAPAPAQWAVAAALEDIEPFLEHAAIFQRKRDDLCDPLEKAGFPFCRPSGAAYVLVDVSDLMAHWGMTRSEEVTLRLISRHGIGTVPADDFYLDGSGKRQIRFCFAVKDALLQDAAARLELFTKSA